MNLVQLLLLTKTLLVQLLLLLLSVQSMLSVQPMPILPHRLMLVQLLPQPQNKKKNRRLRCGWTITTRGKFVSPDGKTFSCRKQAARYYNKNVARLEPERQDGWQVFVDANNTHTIWVAPDGQKLSSYVGAKGYAANANLPIYGKDGLTKTIANFFGRSSKTVARPKTPGNKSLIDMTRTPAKAASSTPPKNNQTIEKTTPKTPRRFKIPIQNEDGKKLQELLRCAAVSRRQNKKTKADQIQKSYVAKYTCKRQVSDIMVRKVCVFVCVFMT